MRKRTTMKVASKTVGQAEKAAGRRSRLAFKEFASGDEDDMMEMFFGDAEDLKVVASFLRRGQTLRAAIALDYMDTEAREELAGEAHDAIDIALERRFGFRRIPRATFDSAEKAVLVAQRGARKITTMKCKQLKAS